MKNYTFVNPSAFQDKNLWNYLDENLLRQENLSEEELTEKILQGFQSWMDDTLPSILEQETAESFEEINKALEEFATAQFSTLTDSATSELKSSLANAFQQWASESKGPGTPSQKSDIDNSATVSDSIRLITRLTQFFQENDWSFTHLPTENALRLVFAGKNGQWNCYAQAREPEQQVVFYSICHTPAPDAKRPAIAEFITRANYGMVLGNFELDYTDGEIRYKTSIDTEGSTLDAALIQNLVYTNIMTMDQYLPGIIAVLDQGVNPQQAIQLIEAKDLGS